MSALARFADSRRTSREVRKVPQADIRSKRMGPRKSVGRSNDGRERSPAKSDPATSRVALPAVGKLAVEAGEQRGILIERDPRTGIDLQCVAPGPRAVDREQRA